MFFYIKVLFGFLSGLELIFKNITIFFYISIENILYFYIQALFFITSVVMAPSFTIILLLKMFFCCCFSHRILISWSTISLLSFSCICPYHILYSFNDLTLFSAFLHYWQMSICPSISQFIALINLVEQSYPLLASTATLTWGTR